MAKFLIFAATGRVGSALCKILIEQGHNVCGVTRSDASAAQMKQNGRSAIVGDMRNPASLAPQMGGFDGVFLGSPDAQDQDRVEIELIAQLKALDVRHVVKLSAQSAGLSPPVSVGVMHSKIEHALKASGLSHTILRPVFFQQTVLLMSDDVAKKNTITAPMGQGKSAMVDTRDVAEVAAIALTDGAKHNGRIYTLTGPTAHGFADIAQKLSDITGRNIKFSSPPSFIARIVMPFLTGMPRWQTTLIIDLMDAIKNGAQETVSPDFADVTGKTPRAIDDFLTENQAMFSA